MASLPFNPPKHTPISPRLLPSLLPMKDLSLFLIKNSLASKMKRGVRSFCHGVGSTSTLNQGKPDAAPSLSGSYTEESNLVSSPKTLEEMLLQLDLEEAAARRAKLDEYGELTRRMSCVNNSDVLSSARNALNQYPRFSLDGRDAMYRSSFRNFTNMEGGRQSVSGSGGRLCRGGYELDVERSLRLPPTVAGECVVWCKPTVVARLMGLDAVPVPVPNRSRNGKRSNLAGCSRRKLRRMGRYELEKERIALSINEYRRGLGGMALARASQRTAR